MYDPTQMFYLTPCKSVSENIKLYENLKLQCYILASLRIDYLALCEKYPYLELFWSVFSRIWTEYGEMLRISPYSVRMWENTDQNTPNTNFFHTVLVMKLRLLMINELFCSCFVLTDD